MSTIKIGFVSEKQREYVANVCASEHIEVEFVAQQDNFEALTEALLQGDFDVFIYNMAKAPTALPENVVITAVSERFEAGYALCVKTDFEEGQLLGISSEAKIQVSENQYLPHLLKEFSASYIYSKTEESEVLVCPIFEMEDTFLEKNIKKLNPREFPPMPAQGVWAYLCHKNDLPTRKILKQLHHPEVSELTNIERAYLKSIAPKIGGAYCEKDKMDNYHLWTSIVHEDGELERKRASSSTKFGLV
jgi:porphobilinogen deaminase